MARGCEGPPIDGRIEEIVAECGREKSSVIPILQSIQTEFHHLPLEALGRVCELTEITPAEIVGVSSFYSQFRMERRGRHLVRVCHGTACHVQGSERIEDAVRRELGIPKGIDTDEAGEFTIEPVACLGCCTLSPLIQIDDAVYGHLSPERIPETIAHFLEHSASPTGGGNGNGAIGRTGSGERGEIRIGLGSCCQAKGSDHLRRALEREAVKRHLDVRVKRVGCVGMCHRTPLIEVVVPGKPPTLYAEVKAEQAGSIVAEHFPSRGLLRNLADAVERVSTKLFAVEEAEPIRHYSVDVRDPRTADFLGSQIHIATEHYGFLNPLDLEEYKSSGGFQALLKCLRSLSPEETIDEVKQSGLRGRGGAGFPCGLKWERTRKAAGEKKYVICNGDEGDPGAFMDRMLLESFPYRIIEGMMIAAHAVGADEGIFYVRAEYPLALRTLRAAIERMREAGLLGDNILGSGFSFETRIMEGAGAFVSGEETALLAAVQGERSIPRLRPPYPAECGLWGRPTSINNVETYASIPWILQNGGERYSQLGTVTSKGTKVFALTGKVKRGGLIEVPMGITIRQIVEEIGGGIAGGRRFKAVQVGGPSGGCIPAHLADTPIDYEALQSVGAIMGSGGLVVLDDSDCMVDIARYFLRFTQNESCGRCTLCRIGTKRMLEIVERLCAGVGKPHDLERLEELAHEVKIGSFCGLGKTAPNPVLTTLKHFRSEYEAHLEGRCPAGKCKDLIQYSINNQCIGCTLCSQRCPVDAIVGLPYELHEIDPNLCTRCDLCRIVCPEKAVEVY